MHEIAAFLRGFPPFEDADERALAAVVDATEIVFFPEGALLAEQGTPNDGAVHVVRTGFVELLADGRVVDVLGPGEIVGLPSLVSGLPPGVDARAAEDVLAYRVPEAQLLPLLEGRSGLRFLARTVRERTAPVRPDDLAETTDEPLHGLLRSVVEVAAATPVSDAVGRMHVHDASSCLVRFDDGVLGIVTDHDLRNRVLAAGLPTSAAIGDVATAPVLTIGSDRSADEAVMTLLAHGIRHLPVVDADGAVVGVVEDVDLLAAQSRTPVRVRRAVARASSVGELVQAAQGIRPAVLGALEAGHPAPMVATTLSTLQEAVAAKAVELHLRSRGVPPAPFVWAVTGSVARREAVLSSDLDTLLAWEGDDADAEVRRWMRSFAADVLATLGACGLAHDVNGVRADDPRFSRSVDAWREALAGWAADPWSDQADIYLAAVGDARPVWGHAVWGAVAPAVAAAHARASVRTALHRVATSHHPPTGFIRDLVIESSGEHAGSVDLKRGGLLPVASLGRYLAALLPGRPLATSDRLRSAVHRGLIAADDAHDLADALDHIQALRLAHQAAEVAAGLDPDDHVRPDELSTLQRRSLRDAFRIVARVQRALPSPVARP
ncbi:MAG: putative nucleotidyltransferase substrate binding domain-containing protein [Candidatus Nanopelagicales bacterium]|jgi:CBS domain-containing protein